MTAHPFSHALKLCFVCLIVTSPVFSASGVNDTLYTYIQSQGIGHIAVQIECPETTRYPQGAPIVVEVGTWFVHYNRFHRVNDTKRIGAVTISYLWPGRMDTETGMQSDGEYDYGGPVSLAALKDVIRFASGIIPDVDGNEINDLSTVPVLMDNVGLFASSHSGVVATNVLAYFGEEIPTVRYLVGRENPTRDEMYPLELGYFNGSPSQQNKVYNAFFHEGNYSSDTLDVDYSTVGWYQPQGAVQGRPIFGTKSGVPEHIMAHDKTPVMHDKRVYSRALTHALLDNGALTLENWPDDIMKPAETDSIWPYRITVHNYPDIGNKLSGLKVMLVFARYDHVQASDTKPHIHQAWDGFHHRAGLWVRMNTDRSYMQTIDPDYGTAFPDNPANMEPVDWSYIEDFGFPADSKIREEVWLASVAEMADRVYADDWSANLDSAYFAVFPCTGETGVNDLDDPDGIPPSFRISRGYPNPFNDTVTIKMVLNDQRDVCLIVYDLRGREVGRIVDDIYSRGEHFIRWRAEGLPSGIYLYRLSAGNEIRYGKWILQR